MPNDMISRYVALVRTFHSVYVIPHCKYHIPFSFFQQVGYAMLAGLGVLLVISPINVCLVRWCRKSSKLGMEEKDKRMKLMNEILNGIKVSLFITRYRS